MSQVLISHVRFALKYRQSTMDQYCCLEILVLVLAGTVGLCSLCLGEYLVSQDSVLKS